MPELEPAIRNDLAARTETPDVVLPIDAATGARALGESVLAACATGLAPTARVLLTASTAPDDASLAALRNAMWPELHVNRVYRAKRGRTIERIDVDGRKMIEGSVAGEDLCVVVASRRTAAMSQSATTVKFDAKAAGWNGEPGSPSYGHFRWMRRLLSDLGPPKDGERVLDAGSGAGWVGIEAGKRAKLSRLCAFDPSPEMVKLVLANAKDNGLEIDARVGFVEDPPFHEEFDLVYDSGVISFAPDPQKFLDGLDRVVRRGGRLIIGDLNPKSSGFARRRRERPVLPSRELSGVTREQIEAWLRSRGYRIDFRRFYQLTWPIPEIAHKSKSHLVSGILLAMNRLATALFDRESWFDSWIVGATKV